MRLLEAVIVELDPKTARQQRRLFLQLVGVGVGDVLHRSEIGVETRAIEGRAIQVLRGAHECSGLAVHVRTQRAEVAAGFGRQKHQRLLRALRNRDDHAFLAHMLVPRLDAREPVVRRRIRGAAQEAYDQQVVSALRLRQGGMDPQAIANLQIGNFGNGQFLAAAADSHFHPRTGQVERGRVGQQRAGQYQKTSNKKTHKGRTKNHISILEAIPSCRDGSRRTVNARTFQLLLNRRWGNPVMLAG